MQRHVSEAVKFRVMVFVLIADMQFFGQMCSFFLFCFCCENAYRICLPAQNDFKLRVIYVIEVSISNTISLYSGLLFQMTMITTSMTNKSWLPGLDMNFVKWTKKIKRKKEICCISWQSASVDWRQVSCRLAAYYPKICTKLHIHYDNLEFKLS